MIRKINSWLNCVSFHPTDFPIHGAGELAQNQRVVLVIVFVLLFQMGEGVVLVGAREKTSTLSPLFCFGSSPYAYLISGSISQGLIFSLGWGVGWGRWSGRIKPAGQAQVPSPVSKRLGPSMFLPPGILVGLQQAHALLWCSSEMKLQSKLVSFYKVHSKILYFYA